MVIVFGLSRSGRSCQLRAAQVPPDASAQPEELWPPDAVADPAGRGCTHAGSAPCHYHGRHIPARRYP